MSAPPDLNAVSLISPPEPRLSLAEGVELLWSNGAACVVFPAVERIAQGEEELFAVDAQLVQNLALASLNQQIRTFTESWFAWSNSPGRYGAQSQRVPWRTNPDRPENLIWIGPDSLTGQSSVFGRPRMEFERDKWLVLVEGLSDPVQRIPWNDQEAIEQAVARLDDWDYWKSLAALMHPAQWRRAMQTEESHRRHALAVQERQREDEIAAAAFNDPNLIVSTRKLARLLRRFNWSDESSARSIRTITMVHCDIPALVEGQIRVAECLDIQWGNAVSVQERREIRHRLNGYLVPHGYEALLTRAGRIYISRDKDLAKTHLHSIGRHRLDSPTVTII